MSSDTHRIHRCAIDLRVGRGARKALLKALHDEPLALTHHVDLAHLEASIRGGHLRVHYMREHPWVGFESDIAILSRHLPHALVRGVSVLEVQNDAGTTLEVCAEKIIGRRGETARIPLRARKRGGEFVVDDDDDDLDAIRERWSSYPRWVQNALRRRYAQMRALPA